MVGRERDISKRSFQPSILDQVLKIYMVWGMKTADRTKCHKTDYHCTGINQWDNALDLNPPGNQIALKVNKQFYK